MGNMFERTYDIYNVPPEIPLPDSKPTFDPHFGFDAPRKKRVAKITEQEMEALKIPPKLRGYCAHLLADYMQCKHDYAPAFFVCRHEQHHYNECLREDFHLRMMEYEREKRLRLRQMKLEGKVEA